MAWVASDGSYNQVYAAHFIGSSWSPAGAGAADGSGVSNSTVGAADPVLAESSGGLVLGWSDVWNTAATTQSVVYVKSWNGTSLVENVPGDAQEAGISPISVSAQALALAVNPAGQPFVAWNQGAAQSPTAYVVGDTFEANRVFYINGGSSGRIYTTAPGSDTNSGLDPAEPLASIQGLMDEYTLQPGDLILIDPGVYDIPATFAPLATDVTVIGAPGGGTTLVSQGSDVAIDAVSDPGFETPSVGGYEYSPSGSPWTFSNSAGLSGNGSGFTSGNPNAPEGTQVAFLQGTGSVSQSINLPGGTYTLGFVAAQRGNYQASYQTIEVYVDQQDLGTFNPGGTSYSSESVQFTVSSGEHTLEFVGNDPNGGDNTAFLDEVTIYEVVVPVPAADGITLQNVSLMGGLAISGASELTLRDSTADSVDIQGGSGDLLADNQIGGLSIAGGASDTDVESNAIGAIFIGGATGLMVRDNTADGITIGSASDGTITGNDISTNPGTAVAIDAPFGGTITGNAIHGAAVGLAYNAAAAVGDNQIFETDIGVMDTVIDPASALGFVGSVGANQIFDNGTGVDLLGQMQGQHIFDNRTGVTGDGILGGNDFSDPNLIESNAVGVDFAGSIQFNQIMGNAIGVEIVVSTGQGSTNLAAGLGNVIKNDGGDGIVASGNVLVAGNLVEDNLTGTGIETDYGAASDNVVFGNATGIYAFSSNITDNRVYDNSGIGVYLNGSDIASGNVVYSNQIGIEGYSSYGRFTGTLANNLVYANAEDGIILNGADGVLIINNTVDELIGDAIVIDDASADVTLRNNILWVHDGYDVNVASDSQTGFASDFNVLYATDSGQIGLWQNVPRPTLTAWQSADFTDSNSISADPLFVNPGGASGTMGYLSPSEDGSDNDFHEESLYGSDHGGSLAPSLSQSTGLPVALLGTYTIDAAESPVIDRGAPTDSFSNEPAPNGGYINIGAYGNTAQASKSPASYVLVTDPSGGENWPQGQTFPIQWRSDVSTANALSFNASSQYAEISDSPTIDSASLTAEGWFNFASTSGTQALITKAAGKGSSSSFAITYSGLYLTAWIGGPGGNGSSISYGWTPQLGTWHEIAFTFDSPSQTETLYLDGLPVASGSANQTIGYDSNPVFLGAQSQNGALGNWFDGTMDEVRFWNSALPQATIQANMNTTLTGSESGLDAYYTFDSITSGTAADITGNGNTAILGGGVLANEPVSVASHAPLADVNIDLVATDGTTLVANIATDVPDDGEFLWTIPSSLAPGEYLVRVTRADNTALSGLSDSPFAVTAPVHIYYVATAQPSGDPNWATAPGNDASSGLDPADPKASISAVLEAYQLGPGDVIRVDAGTYELSTNILLTAASSGYTIEGYNNPDNPSLVTVLDRGNMSNGSYVFELDGATNVTLDHLQMTGGYDGLYGDSGSNSTGLSVTNSTFFGNANAGADLESQNDGANFDGDTFYGVAGNQQTGLLLNNVNDATISDSVSYNSGRYGYAIEVTGSRDLIEGNTVYNCSNGIYLQNTSNAGTDLDTISDNVVREITGTGIYVSGNGGVNNTLVTGNFVYNNTTAYGIESYYATISDNSIHDNAVGILAYFSTTITGNRIFRNTELGIYALAER